MPDVGTKLPKFSLPDQSGDPRTLADLTGKKGLVIYAYPKDNTPGCTVEAQEFTGHLTAFRRRGYNVVGVSKDSVKSHCSFIEKYSLKVPLISDSEAELLQAMGAWGEKKSRGRTYLGIIRTTLVVDATGKILKVYPQVKASGHAESVLEDLKSL